MNKWATNFGDSDTNFGQFNFKYKPTSVKVYDIVLDKSHDDYSTLGEELSIGVIRYAPLDKVVDKADIKNLPFAFPSTTGIRVFPIVNEVVILDNLPSQKVTDKDRIAHKTYYRASPINIWNTPNSNMVINSKVEKIKTEPFIENSEIKPLLPYPGDTLIEGRYGQSIRFGGTKFKTNTYSDDSNNGAPFTFISNGQEATEESIRHTLEDVNKDASSIFLTSNHTVPLKQVRDKNKAWKKPPTKADTYQGSQVIINGGRLYFNSKDESTLFSTKEAFGVTSKTVNLDAKDYIALDANKIYLGEKALREEFEPVILGESMEGFLYVLLLNLQSLAQDLKKAKTVDGKVIPLFITRGKLLEASLKGLQNQINPGGESQLKSRKVYTE